MSHETRNRRAAEAQRFLMHVQGRLQDVRIMRGGLAAGTENVLRFTSPNLWQAFGEARTAAKLFAGITDEMQTAPFVGDRFDLTRGRVIGSQAAGGVCGWRIDWEPPGRTTAPGAGKLLHINWWDESGGARLYGANCVVGHGASWQKIQDLYWEIFSHYPNPFGTPV